MAEKDVSCILVEVDNGWGVLTDSDLRRKLVAEGLPYDTPVSALMVDQAMTVPPERLAIDAMIDMLDLGIHHLPVVDARGTPLGIVTATDLMYLESRTPFAVRRAISKAETPDEVVAAAGHLPQTIVALTRAGVSSVDACRVLALAGDTATTRLIDLAFREHGDAALPVVVDGARQRRPPRADAGLRSGQRVRLPRPRRRRGATPSSQPFATTSTPGSSAVASAPTTPTCWPETASGG